MKMLRMLKRARAGRVKPITVGKRSTYVRSPAAHGDTFQGLPYRAAKGRRA